MYEATQEQAKALIINEIKRNPILYYELLDCSGSKGAIIFDKLKKPNAHIWLYFEDNISRVKEDGTFKLKRRMTPHLARLQKEKYISKKIDCPCINEKEIMSTCNFYKKTGNIERDFEIFRGLNSISDSFFIVYKGYFSTPDLENLRTAMADEFEEEERDFQLQ